MANSTRQYDIVLFGATGYTGQLTASYIAKHAPTDIKWAIAGRSASKLEAVLATCNSLNPNRIQPGKNRYISYLSQACHVMVLFPVIHHSLHVTTLTRAAINFPIQPSKPATLMMPSWVIWRARPECSLALLVHSAYMANTPSKHVPRMEHIIWTAREKHHGS